MIKKTILSVLLLAAVSNAAVKELIPRLTDSDLNAQTKARLELLAVCAKASAPGAAAAERATVSKEICDVLAKKQPVVEVMLPMIQSLERIGGEEAVPALTKLLAHKDERVRNAARRALVANPSAKAGQALAAQLTMRKMRDPKETAGFINALGDRGDSGTSGLIVGYVNHRDDWVFLAAVRALGRLNEDAGVKALAAQRRKEKGYRKNQIDAALFATGRPIVFEKLRSDQNPDVRAVATMGLILAGDATLADQAMKSGDPVQQVAVIEAAVQKKDPALYRIVAGGVAGLTPSLLPQALAALENSGSRACAAGIEPLLTSDAVLIQDSAARALARIGTAESVAPLLANRRPAAKRALGMLNAEGVDAALEKFAADGSNSGRRAAAISALAGRGRMDLVPTFFRYGAEDDRVVASAALESIGQLGDASNITALTELMIAREASPVSRDALNAIVKITRASDDPTSAIDALVGRLDDVSPRSQSNILQALAQTGCVEALKPLGTACTSSDAALRKSAIKMLGGWPDIIGVPAMLELAADKSLSMAEHVTLMRGVSRLYAAESPRKLRKADVQKAIDVCRREEEREALRQTQNGLRR